MQTDAFPITYDEPLFRPPSEGRSLIVQATIGCSWNRCSFCEMYTSKQFRPRPTAEVVAEIRAVAKRYPHAPIRKVFLADGNALVLSNRRLRPILDAVRTWLPQVERVSLYAMPRDILRKSAAELAELRELGLAMFYVGVESGDDEVLQRVDKGETQQSSIEGLQKAAAAGISRSIMILNGLGGRRLSNQHAVHSAAVANAAQPEFLSTLVVSFPAGEQRFRRKFGEDYVPLNQQELFAETRTLLAELALEATEFRSNHASNYLVLKGTLNRDQARLLQQLDTAIHAPERVALRQEWQRGL